MMENCYHRAGRNFYVGNCSCRSCGSDIRHMVCVLIDRYHNTFREFHYCSAHMNQAVHVDINIIFVAMVRNTVPPGAHRMVFAPIEAIPSSRSPSMIAAVKTDYRSGTREPRQYVSWEGATIGKQLADLSAEERRYVGTQATKQILGSLPRKRKGLTVEVFR